MLNALLSNDEKYSFIEMNGRKYRIIQEPYNLVEAREVERLAARDFFDAYFDPDAFMIEKKHLYKAARAKVDELEGEK